MHKYTAIILTTISLMLCGRGLAKDCILVVDQTNGGVAKYRLDGAPENAYFITGLDKPQGITVIGDELYVSLGKANRVAKYDAKSGAIINDSLITSEAGIKNPYRLASNGSELLVNSFYGRNSVGSYNPTTGAAVNTALVADIPFPTGLSVADGYIYISSPNAKLVGKFKLNGTPVSPALISFSDGPPAQNVLAYKSFLYVARGKQIDKYNDSGVLLAAGFIKDGVDGSILSGVSGMAVHKGKLYITNMSRASSAVGVYDAATGAAINASLISGFSASDIIVRDIPE